MTGTEKIAMLRQAGMQYAMEKAAFLFPYLDPPVEYSERLIYQMSDSEVTSLAMNCAEARKRRLEGTASREDFLRQEDIHLTPQQAAEVLQMHRPLSGYHTLGAAIDMAIKALGEEIEEK